MPAQLRSIPFRLAPSYRLTAANPCRSILLCFIPARTALLCYQPTLHRSRSIWFIYYNQKNMHSTSAPSATRDNQLSSLLMRWETFPNRISHSSRYSNINLSYKTAQQPAIVPLRPSAARLLHELSVEIQKIPSHYTAAIGSLCAEPHIKTGW